MDIKIVACVAIILGIVFAYYGYSLQKILVILACFGFGYTLAGEVLARYIADEKILMLVKALVGCVVALLGLRVEKLAVFLGVAYLAYSAIGAYLPAIPNEVIRVIIQLGLAIIVGGFATAFMKELIIIFSALYGAGLIQQYLPNLIANLSKPILTVITILIAITGMIYQFRKN